MKNTLIELQHVFKSFYLKGGLEVPVLMDVNLEIKESEMVAILGPSGSGKSTLMNMIGCLDVPTGGKYLFAGQDVGQMSESELAALRSDEISFIFQSFHLLPGKTVWQNVELPLLYQRGFKEDRGQYVESALRAAALEEKEWHKKPNQLSGGQRQRSAIARALVTKPRLILADEPTGNLDSMTGEKIIDALDRLNNEFGTTIVIVTHDENMVEAVDRVVRIKDGRLDENI